MPSTPTCAIHDISVMWISIKNPSPKEGWWEGKKRRKRKAKNMPSAARHRELKANSKAGEKADKEA